MRRYLVAEVHIDDEWADGAVNLVVVEITEALKKHLKKALVFMHRGCKVFERDLSSVRFNWWEAEWYSAPNALEVLEEALHPEWNEKGWALIDEPPPESMVEYERMSLSFLNMAVVCHDSPVELEVWMTGCAKHDDSLLWTRRIPIELLLDPEAPCQHVKWEAEESEE